MNQQDEEMQPQEAAAEKMPSSTDGEEEESSRVMDCEQASPQDELNKDKEEEEEGSQGDDNDEEQPKRCCCTCTKTKIWIIVIILGVLGILIAILYPRLLPTLAKNKAIATLEVSDETKAILKQLNSYVSVVAAALGARIKESIPKTDVDLFTEEIELGWSKSSASDYGWTPLEVVHKDDEARDVASTLYVEQVRVTDGLSFDRIPNDDIFGTDERINEAGEFLRDCKYLPLEDNIHHFSSEEELDDVLEDLELRPKGRESGYLLPKPHHEWEEMVSDEALSRIFWYGIGSVSIMGPEFSELYDDEDQLVGFEIDMTDLSSLEVREAFYPYGFRITFDTDQTVTSIYDPAADKALFPKDGDEWERAKFLVKQTTMAVVTAREHLQWSHLIAANTMTRANILHLPPNHPIRRLLTVFTYRTNRVNSDAQAILFPEKGYIHRTSGFEYPSLLQVFDAGYKACDIFRPFRDSDAGPGVMALALEGKFPYYTEGLTYYMVVHQFVGEWLTHAGDAAEDTYALAFYEELVASSKGQRYEVPPYTKENMVDEIAQLIWVVTAYHEVVGSIIGYLQRPDFMGYRVTKDADKVETDTESFLLAAYLTGLTGLRMPRLIGEYPNFFGQGDDIPDWEVGVWSDFQDSLLAHSEAVKAADAARIVAGQPEFKLMNPEHFECAVTM